MSPFNMTGAIGMDGKPLQGLPAPVNQGDAISKAVTDDMNASIAGFVNNPLGADLNANSKNITNLNTITFDASGPDINVYGRNITSSLRLPGVEVYNDGSYIYARYANGTVFHVDHFNVDDSDAINRAILKAGTSPFNKLFIGPGHYKTTHTIYQNRTIIVEGSGKTEEDYGTYGTVIEAQGSVSPTWQVGNDNIGAAFGAWGLRDLTLSRSADGRGNATGYIGLYIKNTGSGPVSLVENFESIFSATCVKLGNGATNENVDGTTTFIACDFGGFGDNCNYCVYQDRAIDTHYSNCNFRGFSGPLSAGFCSNNLTNDAFFDNCYIGTVAHAFGRLDGNVGLWWIKGMVLRVSQTQFENGHFSDIALYSGIDTKIEGCNVGSGGRTGRGIYGKPVYGDIYNCRILGNMIGYQDAAEPAIYFEWNNAAHQINRILINDNNIDIKGDGGIKLWDVLDVTANDNVMRVIGTPANTFGIGVFYSANRCASVTVNDNAINMTGETGTSYSITVDDTHLTGGMIDGNVCHNGDGIDPSTTSGGVIVGTNKAY